MPPDAAGVRHRFHEPLLAETPDGSHAEAFDQVVIIGPQGARITLPIAYNDPAGLWTVQATDLYTNETAMTGFTVE